MIFADVTFWQGAEHIATAASILGVIIAWIVATRKKETRKIEPDPLNVRVRQKTAKDVDCQSRHDSAIRAIQSLKDSNESEHRRLYDQIDEAEKRSEDKLGEALKHIGEIIRRQPLEIIELLKSTGQLRDHHRTDK